MTSKKKTREVPPDEPAGGIEEVIEKIRQLQAQQGKNRIEFVRCCCDIGSNLNELKSRVGHGDWEKTVEKLGYNKRTAERLMQVANSWFPDHLRTLGTHSQEFADRLPTDLQKLVLIIKLSCDEFVEALECHHFDQMSREAVSKAVKVILNGISDDGSSGDDSGEDSQRRSNEQEGSGETEGRTGSSDTSDDSPEPTTAVEQLTDVCQQIHAQLRIAVLSELADGGIEKELVVELRDVIETASSVLSEVQNEAVEYIDQKEAGFQDQPQHRSLAAA